jgi:penicillin-binding protein 2
VGLIVLVLFVVLVLRLWSLQILHTKTYTRAVTANRVRVVTVPAPRGLIVDRKDTVLAGDKTGNEIVLSRQEAAQHPSVIGKVAALVTETPAQVQAAITDQQYSPYEPVPILLTAPTATVQYLDNHQSEYPGVSVTQVSQRDYPQGGTTAAQVLGYVGAITATELKAHPNDGYTHLSQVGKTGIEEQYEQYLKGVPGQQHLEVDAVGNVVGTLHETAPTQGDTVELNITANLQKQAQQDLLGDITNDRKTLTTGIHPAATNGALVVLNAETGAVLAMASYPTYTLNEWVGGISTATYDALQAGCNATTGSCALNNNVTQGLYTPGSTFKLATATAALQDGLITPTTTVDDTGTFVIKTTTCTTGCTFHDATAIDAGVVNVTSALVRSDDYFFYTMGYRFYRTSARFGLTPIQTMANSYGMGELTGVDLPGEVQGRVDSPTMRAKLHQQTAKAYPNASWYVATNVEMAFGQGETLLTPIEEAQAYATFADHGIKHQPEVAGAIVGADGTVVKRIEPKVTGHVTISPTNYAAMLNGFLGVTHTPLGTAYGIFQKYSHVPSTYPIAGKTGTATTVSGTTRAPNALFVGFGPTNTTHQYVVMAVVAQGGYGDAAAAPAVADIFNYLYANPVSTTLTLPTATQQPSVTPPTTQPPIGTPATAG